MRVPLYPTASLTFPILAFSLGTLWNISLAGTPTPHRCLREPASAVVSGGGVPAASPALTREDRGGHPLGISGLFSLLPP